MTKHGSSGERRRRRRRSDAIKATQSRVPDPGSRFATPDSHDFSFGGHYGTSSIPDQSSLRRFR